MRWAIRHRNGGGGGRSIRVLAVLVATSAAGCATVPRENLTGFATTTAAIRTSVDQNFAEANRLARSVAIEDFVRSGAIGLTERRFPAAVPTEVASAWRGSLADLQRYASSLATLSSGSRGGDAALAMRAVGVGLRDGRSGVNLDPGIAAAFSGLAGTLIDLKASSDALDIMRRTDHDVRRLLASMADAVGRSDGEGLRGTVVSNWTAVLSDTQKNYAVAAAENAEGRQRTLVAEFLAGIEKRDAQLCSLADLRASLLELADAHAAASAGVKRPFDVVDADVTRRLRAVDETYRAVEKAGGVR